MCILLRIYKSLQMKSFDKYFLLLFLLPGIILFVACKKNDNYPTVNDRIVAADYYTNDTLTSSYSYAYEGERIKTIWRYSFGDQTDTTRTEVDYPTSQSIIITDYKNESGEWNESIRQETDFQNDLITGKTTYTFNKGSWEPSAKTTWQYKDGKILEILHHYYQSGNFRAISKINYEYANGKIGKLLLYHNSTPGWYLYWKEEYEYSGGNFKTIAGYDYFDEAFHQSVKYEFAYSGSDMMSMELRYLIDGNWGSAVKTWNYLYNPDGTLASLSILEGNNTYKVNYAYEEGKGNYQHIFSYPIGQTYDILPGPATNF